MSKIIRSVFIAVTDTDKQGRASLKLNKQGIGKVDLDEYIKDYKYKASDSPDERIHMEQKEE